MSDTKSKVKNFILMMGKLKKLKDDDDIFQLGFFPSLFAVQLVMFVEKEFGITIPNEDLDIDKFRSVNSITQLIGEKLATRG